VVEKDDKEYTIMEGNLLEYPIFSMERRRVNKETEEYIWKESNILGKEIGEKKFRVSCTLAWIFAEDNSVKVFGYL